MYCISMKINNIYLLEKSVSNMLIWVTKSNKWIIVAVNLRVSIYLDYPNRVIRTLRTILMLSLIVFKIILK